MVRGICCMLPRLLVLAMVSAAAVTCGTSDHSPHEERAAHAICVADGEKVFDAEVRDWRERIDGRWRFVDWNGQVYHLMADCILNNPQH